jgi:hypothetical protein
VEQEALFGEMQQYASSYFTDVEKGGVLASNGAPLSNSGMFPFWDRFALYTLVRRLKPRRIIEIGRCLR